MPFFDSLPRRCFLFASLLVLPLCALGCGAASEPLKPVAVGTASKNVDAAPAIESPEPTVEAMEEKSKPKFEAVTLGTETGNGGAGTKTAAGTEAEQMESVVHALQPLQIMLGKWRGTTNQKFKGFSVMEELEWIWDFRTDRAQPALIVKSDKSPYIREGRLTYLPQQQLFQFQVKNPEGVQHVLQGKFERDPEEFTGDDNKPQRSYKLVLTEAEPQAGEAWKVALDQQENNRYLVQFSRKRGSGQFQLADTIGTQRMGTSFAASDEDYGEKKCIISGGLGTSTVSYNGRTYWVCCSGCQAAFNDDPKRWLAKMEEADKAKKK
ncbi:MAG: hypothetical protein V4719_18190 [Planctomycetota bacterium]